MNCVLTQASTVTRSRSMARMHVVGVEALVHDGGDAEHRRGDVRGPDPEPERRGDRAEEHVVAGHLAGLGRELVEVHPPVLGVHDALGHAGGARRRVDQEHVVGPVGAGRRVPRRLRAAIDGHTVVVDHHVVAERAAGLLQHRHEVGGGAAAVFGEGHEGLGAGEGEEVAELVVAGPVAEPDDGQARRARRRRTPRAPPRRRGAAPRPGCPAGVRCRRAPPPARWRGRRTPPSGAPAVGDERIVVGRGRPPSLQPRRPPSCHPTSRGRGTRRRRRDRAAPGTFYYAAVVVCR